MARSALVAVAIASLGVVGSSTASRLTDLPVAAPDSATKLVITGHGWGHGVGMSQWGAYGYALHGWDAAQILAHYFPGTTLGTRRPSVAQVLLVEGAASATIGSAAPWRLIDAGGTRLRLPAGQLVVPASLKVDAHALVSPLAVRPGAAPVEVDGTPYRGSLLLVSTGKALQVVNDVGVESYLDGVVGEEVSPQWPEAALEAQAIAARSYALAEMAVADASGGSFDLYADGRSQVYGGIAAESPAVTAAVAATARRVVLYEGTVATTYFSSSSGGETASAADAMGTPVPYLVSVPDPWDTYSPYHDWGPIVLSPRAAAKALGLRGALVQLELESGPDGRVVSAIAMTRSRQVTLTGAQLRDDLALRSSWFQITWENPSAPLDLPADGSPAGIQASRAP